MDPGYCLFMPATQTTSTAKTLSALDRFIYLPHAPYVVEQMKGLHRAERKRKMGWRM